MRPVDVFYHIFSLFEESRAALIYIYPPLA